jgi:hypothetical protein
MNKWDNSTLLILAAKRSNRAPAMQPAELSSKQVKVWPEQSLLGRFRYTIDQERESSFSVTVAGKAISFIVERVDEDVAQRQNIGERA